MTSWTGSSSKVQNVIKLLVIQNIFDMEDVFAFDAASHTYTLNGKKLTGITTVIGVLAKPALIQWAANEAVKYIFENRERFDEQNPNSVSLEVVCAEARTAHTKKKDAAAEHGTDAHALVEEYINECMETFGGKPHTEEPPESIGKFVDWAVGNVDHFLFSERQMFNKKLFLAGTADFACVMKDGKKLIGDFKTSSGIFGIDYFLQCAGYKILAEGEGDTPYDGCVIVRLGKKGPSDFEVSYRYDSKTDVEAFMACLTIYRAQATFKKPNK